MKTDTFVGVDVSYMNPLTLLAEEGCRETKLSGGDEILRSYFCLYDASDEGAKRLSKERAACSFTLSVALAVCQQWEVMISFEISSSSPVWWWLCSACCSHTGRLIPTRYSIIEPRSTTANRANCSVYTTQALDDSDDSWKYVVENLLVKEKPLCTDDLLAMFDCVFDGSAVKVVKINLMNETTHTDGTLSSSSLLCASIWLLVRIPVQYEVSNTGIHIELWLVICHVRRDGTRR